MEISHSLKLRDDPMISPYDVDFFLSPRGLDVIWNWMEVVVGKILTTYCTSLRKYKKYIKYVNIFTFFTFLHSHGNHGITWSGCLL